jgi:phospholipid transport system transporter-binding protein
MDTVIFTPAKEMTFATADADHKRLVDLCRKSRKSVLLFNLSAVTLCDSAGLALLIEAKRLARKFKKNCAIESMSQEILALAQFCGVEKILLG